MMLFILMLFQIKIGNNVGSDINIFIDFINNVTERPSQAQRQIKEGIWFQVASTEAKARSWAL